MKIQTYEEYLEEKGKKKIEKAQLKALKQNRIVKNMALFGLMWGMTGGFGK